MDKKEVKTKVENLRMLKRTLVEMCERGGNSDAVAELTCRINDLRREIQDDIRALKGMNPERITDTPHDIANSIDVSNKSYELLGDINEDMDFMRNNLYRASFDEKFGIKPFAVRRITHIPSQGSKMVYVDIMNRFVEKDGKIVTLSYLFENLIGKSCGDIVVDRLNKSLDTITSEVFTDARLTDFNEEPISYDDDKINVVHLAFEYGEHKFVSVTEDEAASKEGESQGEQEVCQQEAGNP